jgi:hypothetical protein
MRPQRPVYITLLTGVQIKKWIRESAAGEMAGHEEGGAELAAVRVVFDDLRNGDLCVFVQCLQCLSLGL